MLCALHHIYAYILISTQQTYDARVLCLLAVVYNAEAFFHCGPQLVPFIDKYNYSQLASPAVDQAQKVCAQYTYTLVICSTHKHLAMFFVYHIIY